MGRTSITQAGEFPPATCLVSQKVPPPPIFPSLQLYGDEKMTAMSKTVGCTAAIGTRLVLDGTVDTKGLILPLTKQIYEPALDLLSEEGLVFKESVHVEGPQIQIQA